MRYLISSLLILVSISIHGQSVIVVEPFPESINDNSLFNITSPSMNDEETRLCYKKALDETKEAIMISDKAPDGKWSDSYVVIQFGQEDIFSGCSISPDGRQIYFDLNNDIYRIDHLGERAWSKPQLIGSPISESEMMEASPSISHDNQTISFLRNIRTIDAWQLIPFISQKNQRNEWSNPQVVTIKELNPDDEIAAFYYDPEKKVVFFSKGTSRDNWGNYVGILDNSACINLKKIDFMGGYIVWVSKNLSSGLIITATQPSRIARIKFSKAFVD